MLHRDAQTQVDVETRIARVFGEPSHLVEDLPPDRKTGPRDGRPVTAPAWTSEHPISMFGLAREDILEPSVPIENDAGMADSEVRIHQLGSYHGYPVHLQRPHQFGQPIRLAHLDAIVQEDHRPTATCRRRDVEPLRISRAHRRCHRQNVALAPAHQIARRHDNLHRRILDRLPHSPRPLQHPLPGIVGNQNNADRPFHPLPPNPHRPIDLDRRLTFPADPREPLGNRLHLAAQRIRLSLQSAAGHRCCHNPPMIKNLIDKLDLARSLDHPEKQVPILRPVGIRTPASHLPDMLHTHHAEVCQVISRKHQLGRPFRLEQRRNTLAAFIQAVLIGIQEVDIRLFVDDFHYFV